MKISKSEKAFEICMSVMYDTVDTTGTVLVGASVLYTYYTFNIIINI